MIKTTLVIMSLLAASAFAAPAQDPASSNPGLAGPFKDADGRGQTAFLSLPENASMQYEVDSQLGDIVVCKTLVGRACETLKSLKVVLSSGKVQDAASDALNAFCHDIGPTGNPADYHGEERISFDEEKGVASVKKFGDFDDSYHGVWGADAVYSENCADYGRSQPQARFSRLYPKFAGYKLAMTVEGFNVRDASAVMTRTDFDAQAQKLVDAAAAPGLQQSFQATAQGSSTGMSRALNGAGGDAARQQTLNQAYDNNSQAGAAPAAAAAGAASGGHGQPTGGAMANPSSNVNPDGSAPPPPPGSR